MRAKKQISAYMSVEAAVLFPLVLFVCLFILYSGFYLYDKCVMKQDAYRAALRAAGLYHGNNQEVYNACEDVLSGMASQKYIACGCAYEIKVRDRVRVTVQGELQMPFSVFSYEIEEEESSVCLNPVLFIRTCRRLGIR